MTGLYAEVTRRAVKKCQVCVKKCQDFWSAPTSAALSISKHNPKRRRAALGAALHSALNIS